MSWDHYGTVAIGGGAMAMFSEIPGDSTDYQGATTVEKKSEMGSQEYSPWGSDNNFPRSRKKSVMNSTVAPRALKTRMAAHFGGGIVTFQWVMDETTGLLKRQFKKFEQFEAFKRKNDIISTWRRLIMDYEWFSNCFLQFRLSNDAKAINHVYYQAATKTRLKRMNKQGKITHAFFSHDWPSATKSNWKEIPLFDPEKEVQPKLFVQQIEDPLPDHDYYSQPYWDGVVLSGWLEIAELVPRLKKAVLKNQASLKYHVHIPNTYWKSVYNDWESLSNEEKKAKKNTFYDAFNTFISDLDNTGKSFFSEVITGPDGKVLEGFKIEVIDNKLKDGQYLPDSFGANTEILWAIGINPVLIGMVPSGSQGAGSGSNIREAFHTLQALMHFDREATLAPLRFIRDFNKWDPEMEFGYVNIDTWQTLNQNKSKDNQSIDGTT